jgi:hypothetical protein
MGTSLSGDDPSFYPLEVDQPSRFGGIIHPKDVGAAGLPVQQVGALVHCQLKTAESFDLTIHL